MTSGNQSPREFIDFSVTLKGRENGIVTQGCREKSSTGKLTGSSDWRELGYLLDHTTHIAADLLVILLRLAARLYFLLERLRIVQGSVGQIKPAGLLLRAFGRDEDVPPGSDYEVSRRHTRWRIFDACSESCDLLGMHVCCTPGYPTLSVRSIQCLGTGRKFGTGRKCSRDASTHSIAGIGGLNEWWKESSRRASVAAPDLACRAEAQDVQGHRTTLEINVQRVDFHARMMVFGCGAIWGEFERYVRWCQAAVK
jgi:hypothetical protein